jgi:hypothetical protein
MAVGEEYTGAVMTGFGGWTVQASTEGTGGSIAKPLWLSFPTGSTNCLALNIRVASVHPNHRHSVCGGLSTPLWG